MPDTDADKTKKKKRKTRNLLLDWLLYIALRGLVAFLFLFSVERNLKTAAFLGRLLWKHYTRGPKTRPRQPSRKLLRQR